ncbi:PREDICTED: M-phase phosphoprotein 8-like [Branchiostoma belcheri]|uniref:M-phase phosphoprotein 8-like n=1 Tax=Branchiostoma belcheri TaxID=7741 RepID=A0A6P4ZA06_BRABE|nr:PREDICTED: M-phase phosphoprotein 8-like [Branchiostoma belcheri]
MEADHFLMASGDQVPRMPVFLRKEVFDSSQEGHSRLITKAHPRQNSDQTMDPERRLFEVERIRGKRYQDGKAYYLVRWAGYGPADDTWEPFSNLTRVLDLVVNFEVRYVLKKTPDVGDAALEHAKAIVYKRLYRLIDGMEFLSDDDEEENKEESFYEEEDADALVATGLPEDSTSTQKPSDMPVQGEGKLNTNEVFPVGCVCQDVEQEVSFEQNTAENQPDEDEGMPCLFQALQYPRVQEKKEEEATPEKGTEEKLLNLAGTGDYSTGVQEKEHMETDSATDQDYNATPQKNYSKTAEEERESMQDQAAAGDEPLAIPPVKKILLPKKARDALALITRRSVRVLAKMTEHESTGTSETHTTSTEPASVAKPTVTPKKSFSTPDLRQNKKTPSKRKPTPPRQKRDLSQTSKERCSPGKIRSPLRHTYRPPADGYEYITVRKEHGHVAIIFPGDMPPRAMLRPEAFAELTNALRVADSDNDCKIVTVTGCGGVFCAGVDLTYLVGSDLAGRRNAVRKHDVNNMAEKLRDAVDAIISLSKPLVSLVNGLARGFGTALVALSDIAYASERAVFETPYAALLQTPEGCASLTLPSIVGPAMAKDMLMMGRTLSAEEAYKAGLVSQVYIHEFFIHELKPTVPECMIDKPLAIIRQTKKLVQRHLSRYELQECNQEEYTNLRHSWQAEDCCRAVLAYVERERL